jgi:phosphoribosylglycinamide formyltransferase-1
VKARLQLGVLGSGKGSNLDSIARAISSGDLLADVRLVVSDSPSAGILDVAKKWGLPSITIPPSRFKTRLAPEIEEELARSLKAAGVQIVVLAGYMRMLKAPMLDAFPRAIVNIHPSLLPAFPGMDAWRQALLAGVKVTGCTVHWVDSGMDTGSVIAQREVAVLDSDTPETLHARIQQAEHQLYPQVLNSIRGPQ